MKKFIVSLLKLLFFPVVLIYRFLTRKKIIERFASYEDITARTNAEIERLYNTVAEDMPKNILKYRFKTLRNLERTATKNYYYPPEPSEMDVWVTLPPVQVIKAAEPEDGAAKETAAVEAQSSSAALTQEPEQAPQAVRDPVKPKRIIITADSITEE